MTCNDFSSAFDTIVNSYTTLTSVGDIRPPTRFDEWEKSYYLTRALNEIVKALYNGTMSTFERDEDTRRYLEKLVKQKEYTSEDSVSTGLSDKYSHDVFDLPLSLWYIVYEQVHQYSDSSCLSSIVSEVMPVQHDDYVRVAKDPFRGPTTKRVLRLDKGNGQVEIVSLNGIEDYTLRYLDQPSPIVLEDFDNEQTVEGITAKTECELPSSLHQNILDAAVKMALQDRNINTTK